MMQDLLAVCEQHEAEQWQTERPGPCEEWEHVLSLGVIEGANFAVRYDSAIQRFYQRKKGKATGVVAMKAVARKLARAGYDV